MLRVGQRLWSQHRKWDMFFLFGFFGGFFELNKEKQLSMWVFHSTFVFLGKILWVPKRRSILMYIFGRSNPKWIMFHLPWSRNDQKNISGNFVYIDPEGNNLDICSDSLGKTLSWPWEFLLHQKLATCITCSAFGTYRPWKLTACPLQKLMGLEDSRRHPCWNGSQCFPFQGANLLLIFGGVSFAKFFCWVWIKPLLLIEDLFPLKVNIYRTTPHI